MTSVRYLRVRDAELSVRVANTLCRKFGEDLTIGDLFSIYTDLDLLNAGVGRKGLKEVREMIELARVNGIFEPKPPVGGSSIVAPSETKTLRDEFAMAALPVLLAKHPADRIDAPVMAYAVADKMMVARGK